MNKQALVKEISLSSGKKKKDVETILNTLINTIIEVVSSGERVTLVGFGTFENRKRKQREGRNPQNGESITIPEAKVPYFSAGKLFKESVNGFQ